MIEWLPCAKIWLRSIMQKLKCISFGSLTLVRRYERRMAIYARKCIFEALKVLVIANNRMMLLLLLFIQLLLIVMAIPKVIVAANVS